MEGKNETLMNELQSKKVRLTEEMDGLENE